MRGSPSQNALTIFRGHAQVFAYRVKQQGNMGSARYVARRVLHVIFRRTAGVTVTVVGVASTFTNAGITIVNHVAFIRSDHHRIILGGEGSD